MERKNAWKDYSEYELMRLEASLKAAGDKIKLVFLHYPPKYKGYTCEPILELLKKLHKEMGLSILFISVINSFNCIFLLLYM